ncbi:hypothetical protein AVEN_215758-1 [Araneus ventricosus]|uniref:Uncharacterized protein n=1 Tax=Araneus ventricosus TaxID=182803 RepID=A0A4Y2JRX5_ARAVE|nr:hypothetical protein AVEN_215758-1 [Araneus ventricosus]
MTVSTSGRRQGVGRPHVIRKGRGRLSRLVKKAKVSQTVAQLTARYSRSEAQVFQTHSSAATVGYGAVQQTSHSLLLTKHHHVNHAYSGPGTSRLDHGWSGRVAWWMNLISHSSVDGRVQGTPFCQANSCSPLVQPQIHTRRLVVAVVL